MNHEIKKVTIGPNVIEITAFPTFLRLTFGGYGWGEPSTNIMMSHESAGEIAAAITSTVAKVTRTEA